MLQAEQQQHNELQSSQIDWNDLSEVDSSSHYGSLAASFQTLLRTRRTSSHYQFPSRHTPEYYRSALDRAVLAGRSAPNHKRTEAVSFRRIASPETIAKLAEIATRVSQNPHKGEKWRKTPAFLVTLVHHETGQEGFHRNGAAAASGNDDTAAAEDAEHLYVPLPYTPPVTERELEDYAAACAATQNVLLSLHAEGLATKWATGPVIQTPAFRQLVHATDTDRVAALVFVGESASETVFPRRYRRDFHGDFLRDV